MHRALCCVLLGSFTLAAQNDELRVYRTPAGKKVLIGETGTIAGLYGKNDCVGPGGECIWEVMRISARRGDGSKRYVLEASAFPGAKEAGASLKVVSFSGPATGTKLTPKTKLAITLRDDAGQLEVQRTISLVRGTRGESLQTVDRVTGKLGGTPDVELAYYLRCRPSICGPDDPEPPGPGPVFQPARFLRRVQRLNNVDGRLIHGQTGQLKPRQAISVSARFPIT